MKILNISSLYPPNVVGGAEQGLQTISRAMVELGHEVHVITLQAPGQDEVDGHGVTVHLVPLANGYWPFDASRHGRPGWQRGLWHARDTHNTTMASRVTDIVKRVQPDVVLTRNLQGFSTSVMPAVRRLGVPLVHVLHDYALVCPQTTLFRNGSACGLRTERCVSCKVLSWPRRRNVETVDGVIGVSDHVLSFHRDHGLFKNTPGGVIHNALKPAMLEGGKARALPAKRPFRFGFIGRIEKFKGVETLLGAARQLSSLYSNFELLLAGRGDAAYVKSLESRFEDLPVRFLGFTDSIGFYRDIDALIYPSEWLEALGNGVFEAFSQGVPVIGSNIGGIPETIDDGDDGLIFPAGSEADLSDAMGAVMSDRVRYESMSRAALKKVDLYAPKARAGQYIDWLYGFLQQRGNVA